ncbi:MAG: hypothetical protein PHO30_05685 [Candidatus Omnitrophica bacterium]|nr:hypothetical protein [Candidatus Omnitrophota bacterium]
MKRLMFYFLMFVQICSVAGAQTQQLSPEQYYPVLADCNIAAYAAIRYAVFNTGGADAQKLKRSSPVFSGLVRDFENKLSSLERASLSESELQVVNRLFSKQYRKINSCLKDMENDLSSGNNYSLLGNIAKGKYLFRDLKCIYEMFGQSLTEIADKEANK